MLERVMCMVFSSTKILYLRQFCNHHRLKVFHAKHVKYCTTASTKREPLIVKLDEEAFKSILSPELLTLHKLFKDYGHEVRVVGGAVRDLLMGQATDDLDLCTPATPEEMKYMYKKAGIRILNTRGEKHGTVPIRINDKQNFEVTTLRVDIRTDGRHAVVNFTTDWRLDALRRDLTVNSLFLDFDGYIYDYFNGIEDVKNRRVQFVNEAETRIKEDYLRILRYFRFYGRIALHPDSHENNVLQAIKHHAQGLDKVSGERIWTEVGKIVTGRFADSIMRTMFETGVTNHIGLPGSLNFDEFSRVCENTAENQPDPMTRMAALFTDIEQLEVFHSRVSLSKKQFSLCAMILEYRNKVDVSDLNSIVKHYCLSIEPKRELFRYQMAELCKYHGNTVMARTVTEHQFPNFPITRNILSSEKRIRRKYTDDAMQTLSSKWVESGYKLSKHEILHLADQFIDEHKDKYDNLLYTIDKKEKKK